MEEMPLIDAAIAQKIVSKSLAIIYICKASDDYAVTYITPNIVNLVGYSDEDFFSAPDFWINHVHPDDKAALFSEFSTLFKLGHHEREYRFLHKDGQYRWLHDELILLSDDDGNATEIMGHWRDITDNKQIEYDLKNTASQLEATLNATADGLVVVRRDGVITNCNQKFIDMWQIPDEVMASRQDQHVLGYVLPQLKHPEGFYKKVSELGDNPEMKSYDVLDFKDGKTFELYSKPQWIDGVVTGRVWSFRDVTALAKEQAALMAAKNQAEMANRAKSDFLTSMSHELRTPMNAIMGFSQLMTLNADEPLSVMQRSNVKEIMDASKHLLTLINEVLDLAQIESGMLRIELEKVSILTIVQQCIHLTQPLIRERAIKIVDDIGACDCWVMADSDRFMQVLLNLMSNAVKYNRPAGTITLAHCLGRDSIRIQVTDTGHGIDAHELNSLFDPFERLEHKNGPIEGTGIGLNVAKQLIEAMDGNIGVSSVKGEGSTFWVELPRLSA